MGVLRTQLAAERTAEGSRTQTHVQASPEPQGKGVGSSRVEPEEGKRAKEKPARCGLRSARGVPNCARAAGPKKAGLLLSR